MVARAADKYDIKGFIDLLCFKMKIGNIKNEFIADRHDSKELVAVALGKLRADRNILNEKGFRQRMSTAENKDLVFELHFFMNKVNVHCKEVFIASPGLQSSHCRLTSCIAKTTTCSTLSRTDITSNSWTVSVGTRS